MDANGKASKISGEISMIERKTSPNEVVLSIIEDSGENKDLKNGHHEPKGPQGFSVDSLAGLQKAVPAIRTLQAITDLRKSPHSGL
ncbi:hypothetical protein Leryth_023061 [Lithospermum erythrorhizon]|nr:hypothetical protein Leryth_023061 [Lithospermum erythrorhizon]